MTSLHFTTTATPAGAFSWISDLSPAGDPQVLASGWTSDPSYLATLAGLAVDEFATGDQTTHSAIADFFDGNATALDRVQVKQTSGPFIEHAWTVLRTVSPGAQVSYTEFADRAGRPAAVRAAASACASNRCALFVPCHRVLRSDGSLGGFRYGLQVKKTLLDFEASHFG